MKIVIASAAISIAAFMSGYYWPTKPVQRPVCAEQKQKLISTVEQDGYLICRYIAASATYGRTTRIERIKL